jgi:threonine dehydratase
VSPKTPDYKLAKIRNNIDDAKLHFTKRPVSDAFKFSKEHGYKLLRSSTDKYALEGYKAVAQELITQVPKASDIFVPSSSGTLALGIYEGYKELTPQQKQIPTIHVVQTTKVNVLTRQYDTDFKKTNTSAAQAIVDRVGHRRKDVAAMIEKGHGAGWIVDNENIMKFYKILHENNIKSSEEGAMGLAALQKALDKGYVIKIPVCIITGAKKI